MKSPENSRPPPTAEVKPTPVLGPDIPDIVSSELFVADAKTPLSNEEYLERVEAILKILGLPPLAEVNRMEAETEVRANTKAAKPRG